jgi:hypothetical protein
MPMKDAIKLEELSNKWGIDIYQYPQFELSEYEKQMAKIIMVVG